MLMIDDSALHARVARELTKLHYQLSSPSGEPIQMVFDEVPHLVIVDEDFGGRDGRSIALTIKEDMILKFIPVILMINSAEHLFRASDEPIDFYFEKGQGLDRLLFCVHEAMTEHSHELDLNPLTHFPGMRTSVLQMERALRSKESVCVCYADLANLEVFNSAYGDSRGDEVIIRLGQILQETIKRLGARDDFLGHLGGGNFLVLTHSERAVAITEAVIRHFDARVGQFYDVTDHKRGHILQRNKEGVLTEYPMMSVSVSIVDNADRAAGEIGEIGRIAGELKKAMRAWTGSCHIHYSYPSKKDDPPKNASLEVRFPTQMKSFTVPGTSLGSDRLTAFLHGILRDKKIRTVFQPVLDLKVRRIIGYEALTRGATPGLVDESTLLFNLARESGRIIKLDKLCVDVALKSSQSLDPDRRLFLNVNLETLIDPAAMRDLFAEKGSIGFKSIVIEITEQGILRSFGKVKDALHALRQEGVSVAIDDVGGGAVSLRDVAILKPDYIKFDRSLIREIDTTVNKQQIVLSLILFANGIQALTVAEGIETKEELSTVRMCGVQLGQGYYFAKPGKAFPKISSTSS